MDTDCHCKDKVWNSSKRFEKSGCVITTCRTPCLRMSDSRSKLSLVPHKFGSTLWTILFILHACAFFSNAQQFGFRRDHVRDTYDFDTDFPDDISSNFPDLGDDDDFSQKNMHLFAVTGHHFNRSLVDDIKAFDPNVISNGDVVKVHFPRYDMPGAEWMVYHEDTGLLQGVPLSSHEGLNGFYITVIHVNAPSQSALTLPCTVEVIPEEKALDMKYGFPGNKLKIDTPLMCSQHDPVTLATISLKAESRDLSHLDRLHCVQNLGNFFDAPAKDVTFYPSSEALKRGGPIESGPGNVPKVRTHRGDRDASDTISLSWPLGCNSDIIGDIPSLDKLETTALDGSLARAIGYDVTEWQIVNRVHHFKRVHRTKRRAGGVPSSAGIFYPPAIRLGGDNIKIMEDVGTEVPDTTFQRGRTRVSVNMIRATPVPEMPIKASRIMTPPNRAGNVVAPSTPSIAPPMMENEAPMLLFGMQYIVNAIAGTYMELQIPNGAFYDAEDGMTRALKLEILDAKTHEDISEDQTWINFDAVAHLVYGVPDETAVPKREFIVIARDSGGKSVSLTFSVVVDVEDKKNSTSHTFTFVFSKSPDFTSKNEFFQSFGKKLTTALAMIENVPGHLTMLKTGLTKSQNQRFISWFDRSFDELEGVCQSRGIKNEADLMIGEDAGPGRNRPAKEFAAKFGPEYKLKSIKIELLGPCVKHTTTTSIPTTVSTTTTPPTTTTTLMTTTTSTTITSTESVGAALTTLQHVSTTKMAETTTTKTPMVPIPAQLGKALPQITTQAGKITKLILPSGTFTHPKISENELKLELSGETPPWMSLDSDSRTIYLMPTREDFVSLRVHNATHKIWQGSLVAKTMQGASSEPLMFDVLVQQAKPGAEKKANHKFSVVIKNYNIMNFTGTDRMRLLNVIVDIFGDSDASKIYFFPLQKGSVVFSWQNTSMAYIDPCPYNNIAMLSMKVFEKSGLTNAVKARFAENDFDVRFLNLSRASWCKAPIEDDPVTESDVAIAGRQGKSTTIIIIAVVVVCLVILIVILVVKCRMGQTTKEKREEKREKQEREEAAIAVGSPDISEAPRIKKGVPIIFQDELAMEPNGNAHASPATPLVTQRNNGDMRSPAVTEDDDNIHEETQFTTPSSHHPMTPPTPIMSDRPPPPYVKLR